MATGVFFHHIIKSVFFEIVTPLFVRGKFLRVTMCNLIVCAFQNWKISHARSFGGDNFKKMDFKLLVKHLIHLRRSWFALQAYSMSHRPDKKPD